MRKPAAVATAMVSLALVAPPSAPNADRASCEAILTSPDAHVQIRDEVAREVAAEDFPPGDLYSVAARATGRRQKSAQRLSAPTATSHPG